MGQKKLTVEKIKVGNRINKGYGKKANKNYERGNY